jgi:hypothetical protein
VALAAVVLLIDGVAVFLPLTALVIAYVLVARPAWFKDLVNQLYQAD